MNITITINLDNDAFEKRGTDLELSRILREFAYTLHSAILEPNAGRLYDANGNPVGKWCIEEE